MRPSRAGTVVCLPLNSARKAIGNPFLEHGEQTRANDSEPAQGLAAGQSIERGCAQEQGVGSDVHRARLAQDALREAEAAVAKAREDTERAEREQVEAAAAVGNSFAVIEKKWAQVCEDILKMLPTDASDELKKAIGDLVHNRVEQLDLRHNKISDEGAKALAEALKVNTALQVLSLFLTHRRRI